MARNRQFKLSLYRKRQIFWVAARDRETGDVRHMSLHEKNPGLARALHEQLQGRWAAGEDIFPPRAPGAVVAPGSSWEAIAEGFCRSRKGKVTANTIANDRARLRLAGKHWGDPVPGRVTRAQVDSFLEWVQANRNKKTRNQYVMTIKNFFEWTIRRRLRGDNPAVDWKVIKAEHKPVVYLAKEEHDAVLATVRGHAAEAEVLLTLGCGGRLSEAERADWPEIDTDRKQWRIPQTKSGWPRTVPIPAAVARRLAELRPAVNHGRVPSVAHGRDMRVFLAWLRAESKAKKAGWLVFRHTYGSLRVQKGVSLYKVGEWLGHKDPRTTKDHYAVLAPDHYDPDVEI